MMAIRPTYPPATVHSVHHQGPRDPAPKLKRHEAPPKAAGRRPVQGPACDAPVGFGAQPLARTSRPAWIGSRRCSPRGVGGDATAALEQPVIAQLGAECVPRVEGGPTF